MKIIIDDKIPYIKGALESFTEVIYLPGGEITPEAVKDADAIVTRTRTICDARLLKGSKVKFIATATIGFDHIDADYCQKAGIQWANAPGCNAESVHQYMASALLSYARRNGIALAEKTIGIVGVGHVGSKVARLCRTIGMKVLLNDPPRERLEGPGEFVDLEEIKRQADIISFHVPLQREGPDKTFHMVDNHFLKTLEKHPLLINTCRGEIFDSKAVLQARRSEQISGLVIDCWEGEPDLDLDLLHSVDIATPHIAGYSRDGKAKGTMASIQNLSKFFNLNIDDWTPSGLEQPEDPCIEIDGSQKTEQSILTEAVLSTYQIEKDDATLRNAPHQFEKLRGDYPVRREFGAYSVRARNIPEGLMEKMKSLGFSEFS